LILAGVFIFIFILTAGFEFISPQESPVDDGISENILNIAGAAGSRIILLNYDNATDPTYEELKKFLKADSTDRISYDRNSFVCADYAHMIHNNAERSGIKAGFVSIDFYEINDGHACNVFNTIDKGLVFVDCTAPISGNSENSDTIVNMGIGKKYEVKGLFGSNKYYGVSNYRGLTVKNYKIFW
jgi:hypothetical protein